MHLRIIQFGKCLLRVAFFLILLVWNKMSSEVMNTVHTRTQHNGMKEWKMQCEGKKIENLYRWIEWRKLTLHAHGGVPAIENGKAIPLGLGRHSG